MAKNDNGKSIKNNQKTIGIGTNGDITDLDSMAKLIRANNLYNRTEIEWYTKFNRFSFIDPYNSVTNTKEYLFFVRPDLHIYNPGTTTLYEPLAKKPFFVELHNRYPEVIHQLQKSAGNSKSGLYHKGPFMNVLSNSVRNTLSIPGITLEDIDNSANIYGTSIEYSGNGYKADEGIEFTLEFEDTKYLEIYHMLKAYDEYQRMKNVGLIYPPNINNATVDKNGNYCCSYTTNKELHDQFGIYKFIVDDDYSTIIYYAYFCGVRFKNVPRDAFSELKADGGLRLSVDFKASFMMDMDPRIIMNFNSLISSTGVSNTKVKLYDNKNWHMNGDWVGSPIITKYSLTNNTTKKLWNAPSNMSYQYKLEWRK